MIGAQPRRGPINFGFDGPFPKDVLFLVAIVFVTFSMDALVPGWIGIFQLSNEVWLSLALWKVVTYPFMTSFGSAFGLIISMWMIAVFGRQVFNFVGRRAFWRSFFTSTVTAALVALLVRFLMDLGGMMPANPFHKPFGLMDGQFVILAIMVTGFGVLYGHHTVYLMFILPVRASWFIGIEIFFAFLAFLSSRDLAGFLGICAAVTMAYFMFSGVSPRRFFHEMRMRLHRRWLEAKLRRMNRRGGGGDGGVVQGPWVN